MLKKRMFMVLAVILSCAFLFSGCKQNVGTPEDNAVPDEDTQSDADTENGEEAEEEDSFLFGFTAIDMENPYFITLESDDHQRPGSRSGDTGKPDSGNDR